MITIIHGDDTVSSRQYYLDQKKIANNPVSFEGKTLALSDILQSLEGGGLFSDDKTIFIEEFFSSRKESKEYEEILKYLNNNKDKSVFFWENKDLSRLKNVFFKNAVLKAFTFLKDIFTFLDNIRPHNPHQVVLFHNLLKHTDPEVLFFLLIRQLRLLLAVSNPGGFEIDEVKRLAPWQKSKLNKQAHLFSTKELKLIYKTLYDIDLSQKTGSNESLSLSASIDFLLLNL